MHNPADLYLDLLKRSLTNTIFNTEPDIDDDEFRFTMACATQYVNSDAVSMITHARFDNIKNCIESILRDGVPGDFIEAGVWRGGASIFMRAVLKAAELDCAGAAACGWYDRHPHAVTSFGWRRRPVRMAETLSMALSRHPDVAIASPERARDGL